MYGADHDYVRSGSNARHERSAPLAVFKTCSLHINASRLSLTFQPLGLTRNFLLAAFTDLYLTTGFHCFIHISKGPIISNSMAAPVAVAAYNQHGMFSPV